MRRALPLLVALALLVPLALAAPGRPTPATLTPGATHDREDDRGGDDDDAGDRSGEGRARRDAAAVGEFSLSASSQAIDGDFVDFSYNDSSLSAFTVSGTRLFDLQVSGARGDEGENGVVARGAQVRIRTPYYALQVHDNPAAVTQLETDAVATLLFPAGANLTAIDDERIAFTVGNVSGAIRGDGARIAGLNVIASDELLILVNAAVGGFDRNRVEIGRAATDRNVGAEASFNRNDGGVEEDIIQYGNVTLRTLKAERGNLTVEVEGHGFDGRVIVLNVDGQVVGASKRDDLTVLFDDVPIGPADTIVDVLDPDDDGLRPEYYLVFDPATEAFQVIVSVPHYSVHTLSVMTLIEVAPPSVVVGLLAGLLVLAASGFILFRRK